MHWPQRFHRLTQCRHHLRYRRQIVVLLSRHGIRSIVASDTPHGFQEGIEAVFVDDGCHFSTDAARPGGFVYDDGAARFLDGRDDRLFVKRPDGTQVDDFDAGAHFLLRLLRGFEGQWYHSTVGEETYVCALLYDSGFAKWDAIIFLRRLLAERAIELDVFEEKDRVGVLNG